MIRVFFLQFLEGHVPLGNFVTVGSDFPGFDSPQVPQNGKKNNHKLGRAWLSSPLLRYIYFFLIPKNHENMIIWDCKNHFTCKVSWLLSPYDLHPKLGCLLSKQHTPNSKGTVGPGLSLMWLWGRFRFDKIILVFWEWHQASWIRLVTPNLLGLASHVSGQLGWPNSSLHFLVHNMTSTHTFDSMTLLGIIYHQQTRNSGGAS